MSYDESETVHAIDTWVFVTLGLLVVLNIAYMLYCIYTDRQENKRLKSIEEAKKVWLTAQEVYMVHKKLEEEAEEKRKNTEPLPVINEESSEESSSGSGSSESSSGESSSQKSNEEPKSVKKEDSSEQDSGSISK